MRTLSAYRSHSLTPSHFPGPVIAGFINQHLNWRWTWRIFLIWAGVELLLLVLFVPETFLPALLVTRARKLRKEGRTDVRAPLELDQRSLARVLIVSCGRPFGKCI